MQIIIIEFKYEWMKLERKEIGSLNGQEKGHKAILIHNKLKTFKFP